MSQYSFIVGRIHRLQHIQANLDKYTAYFSTERYSWLTPTYLTQKLAGAEEYFQNAEKNLLAISEQSEKYQKSKEALHEITAILTLASKAYLKKSPNTTFQASILGTNNDIGEKSGRLLDAVGLFVLKNPNSLPEIDFSSLSAQLRAAREAFLSEKSAFDQLKTEKDTKKSEFVVKMDEIDDLYHDVANAIEGALHENYDIQLELMPWRKKTASTPAKQSETTPN